MLAHIPYMEHMGCAAGNLFVRTCWTNDRRHWPLFFRVFPKLCDDEELKCSQSHVSVPVFDHRYTRWTVEKNTPFSFGDFGWHKGHHPYNSFRSRVKVLRTRPKLSPRWSWMKTRWRYTIFFVGWRSIFQLLWYDQNGSTVLTIHFFHPALYFLHSKPTFKKSLLCFEIFCRWGNTFSRSLCRSLALWESPSLARTRRGAGTEFILEPTFDTMYGCLSG